MTTLLLFLVPTVGLDILSTEKAAIRELYPNWHALIYMDDNACALYRLSLSEGKLPTKKNEIAVSKKLLKQLSLDLKEAANNSITGEYMFSVTASFEDTEHPELEWGKMQKNNPLTEEFRQEILQLNGIQKVICFPATYCVSDVFPDDHYKTWKDGISMTKMGCYLFLGMLQSIGMSDHQLLKMLQVESLFYTSGTILIAATGGSALGYPLFLWAKKNAMYHISSFHYPAAALLLMIGILLLVQAVTTLALSKAVRKDSLIDRIRFYNQDDIMAKVSQNICFYSFLQHLYLQNTKKPLFHNLFHLFKNLSGFRIL